MEEKERYIVLSGRQIKDTANNSQDFLRIETVCKRLNQQEKENKQLKQQLEELNESLYQSNIELYAMKNLRQQLHDLPKKIVCEISEAIERLSWRKRIYTNWEFDKEQLYKDLDTILKKYEVEDEN